ncbi:LxmA leader domain family RiPP [Streptomyces sioyaensis]|uniref:LxmA leader domain family RiPP n=1 Tax=Streptomyces sioyaensis TaxID=67364 RepID=UPI003D713B1F
MNENIAMMELVGGFDAYAQAEELNFDAAVDAPATTPGCITVTASIVTGASVLTAANGC